VDRYGDLYVAGLFTGFASIDGLPIQSDPGLDVYVAKFSHKGELLWIKQSLGGRMLGASHVAVQKSGELYLAGSFSGSGVFSFGDFSFPGQFYPDIFVAKLDSSFPVSPLRLSVLPADEFPFDHFRMSLSSDNPVTVVIQASTNLANWTSISTNSLPAGQTVVFEDTAGLPSRYYRAAINQ
jgi:hypothetical protein